MILSSALAIFIGITVFAIFKIKKVCHRLALTLLDNETFSFSLESKEQVKTLLPPSAFPFKPTLVLDLDETLVHATIQFEEPPHPARMIMVEGCPIWLALRPFARQFLSSLSIHYELVVWTAGKEAYGRAVVKELDPTGSLISHSLFRQDCTVEEDIDGNRVYIKDLSLLGRDERTRICDNNPDSFYLQPASGILVEDFLGDPEDTFLFKLLTHLTKAAILREYGLKLEEVRHVVVPSVTTNCDDACFVSFSQEQEQVQDILETSSLDNDHVDDVTMETLVRLFHDLRIDDGEMVDEARHMVVSSVTPHYDNACFVSVHQEQVQENDFKELEPPQEDTAPKTKRPRKPRVSHGEPLRRSARLAAKNKTLRRSPRLAAKQSSFIKISVKA